LSSEFHLPLLLPPEGGRRRTSRRLPAPGAGPRSRTSGAGPRSRTSGAGLPEPDPGTGPRSRGGDIDKFLILFSCRDTDVQHLDTNNVFHSPGVYYRPNELKSMRCLLGNTEVRTVYQNFELLNLNTNMPDRSHILYSRYLQTQKFIPPGEQNYFEHTSTNTVPTEASTVLGKGVFNIFPLSLTSDEMDRTSSSSLGRIRIRN
jgi:hypothetical protein